MGKDLNGKDLGKGFSQRKDGRYEARAMIKGKTIDLYDTNLTRLRKKFSAEKKKLQNIEGKSLDKPSSLTLKDWYEDWFENFKKPTLKETSWQTYDRKIRNTYIRLIGDKKLGQIAQRDIQLSTNQLSDEGRSNKGIREACGVLRECLDIAVVNFLIEVNPCQGIIIKADNKPKSDRRVLEIWEQDLFLSVAKNTYYYDAYIVLLTTGIRIGEFSGLQWEDIDFINKKIKIRRSMSVNYIDGIKTEQLTTPKTQTSYREIPMFKDTEQALVRWRKNQQNRKEQLGNRWRCPKEFGNLVFTSSMGSPATRYVISHDLRRVVKNMQFVENHQAEIDGRFARKIENIYPHAFRHTFATRCFEKGMNPIVVQSMLGHANYNMTLTYTHLTSTKESQEINKIGTFLSHE